MSTAISSFENTCLENNIYTSLTLTVSEHIYPEAPKTNRMIVRFWTNQGEHFTFSKAQQDGSVVFDETDGSITYPDQKQLEKLDSKVQCCIRKFLSYLDEEKQFPVTIQKIREILGSTVVVLSPTPPPT